MTEDVLRMVSQKYCQRFGHLAVELGFIDEPQLTEALARQVHLELAGKGHKLLGQLMFEADLMSAPQIDQVMTILSRRMRDEG